MLIWFLITFSSEKIVSYTQDFFKSPSHTFVTNHLWKLKHR
jgi:hypothetical protein